ncbi:MAG: diguanylate cyclase [Candidatus Thiodiazotropha sp. (ex Monitilora ramsayi)]|nr:diguanylate cyclase [Candidatus Thiodiazotropha sp. (ex Monitilora ramsayi)]
MRTDQTGNIDSMPQLEKHADKRQYYPQLLLYSLALGCLYYLTGVISLTAQSAQTGITPLWLPSGVAFAAFFIFGIRHWPGVFFGMCLISLDAGIPMQVAFIAALGSVLEAAIPVILLRYLGFLPSLDKVKSVFAFTLLASILGPVISASIGILAFSYFIGNLSAPHATLWFFWWLGNSIGIITLGAFLLSWHQQWRIDLRSFFELILLALTLGIAVYMAVTDAEKALSVLLLFLATPILLFSALRHGPRGVTLLSLAALMAFFITGAWIEPGSFNRAEINYLIIDIAYVAVAVFTGLIVAATFAEQTQYQSLRFRADHDHLTKLFNHAKFMEYLEATMASAQDKTTTHYLLFLDLDDLKTVNDMAGHEAGNRLIQHTAEIIRNTIRQQDVAGRTGGDEFAVLLRDCHWDFASALAEEIRRNIAAKPFQWGNHAYDARISIGGKLLDDSATNAEKTLSAAEAACYQAKQLGGNRAILLSPATPSERLQHDPDK